MKAVSDRVRNPFGINPPCERGTPVPGYGDPAAHFHVIGDHPGRHGGAETGVPFTRSEPGARLQRALAATGLVTTPDDECPAVSNLFFSYLYPCPVEPGRDPPKRAYDDLERFFDAELRAVNAHILMPVGRRTTDHLLREYSTRYHKEPMSMYRRHAREIRGGGFLILPIADPRAWRDDDESKLVGTLAHLLDSDYRQTKGVATTVG